MARPLKEIDPAQVEMLASLGCKNTEIASLVGCSIDTLDRRFADEMRKGRDNLKMSLRRKQIETALSGNVVMLIFLGKNLLGQADKVETKAEISDTTVVTEEERAARIAEILKNGAERRAGEDARNPV